MYMVVDCECVTYHDTLEDAIKTALTYDSYVVSYASPAKLAEYEGDSTWLIIKTSKEYIHN